MLMYFPPKKEPGDIIVESSKFLLQHNIRVPQLYAYDLSLGLVLQEDMGEELLFKHCQVSQESSPPYEPYRASLQQLNLLQGLDASQFGLLGQDKLLEEMQLFSDWLIDKWLGVSQQVDMASLLAVYSRLAQEIITAPICCVHLDFHSRNLTILPPSSSGESETIGILDYQDLLQGHFCYDIWSLLRDAYVRLPEDFAAKLFGEFSKQAQQRFSISRTYVHRHYNLIGVQRCLKVCGTFARLFLRDGKQHYLPHVPLVMGYLQQALQELSQKMYEGTEESSFGMEQIELLQQLMPKLLELTEQKLSCK